MRSLQTAAPKWEGHDRAEALIRGSGVQVDHVAGDRAYYSLKEDRVVLPERNQCPSQDAYTHTALHELWVRRDRPFVKLLLRYVFNVEQPRASSCARSRPRRRSRGTTSRRC